MEKVNYNAMQIIYQKEIVSIMRSSKSPVSDFNYMDNSMLE